MVHNGNRYSEEFKRQIIDLYLSGKPVKELADEYGLVEQTIYKWKKLYAATIKVDENKIISLKEYNALQKKMRELEMENEILKKSYSHIRQKTITEIVAFITKYQTIYPIKLMCKVLGINRSTYYKVANKVDSARTIENQKLDADILAIYFATKRRYGAPKIHHELLNQCWNISLKKVQRQMAELGIHSIVIKKYHHYSSNKRVAEKDNILNQDFTATGINQKWCTDITYIHTQKDGWTYLASVMDLYNRKIIGWAYDINMSAELAIKAVKNACLNVSNPEGIVLQSDLGTQYTSDIFERFLVSKKICHSYSRKGCPYDNACIESFHSLIKKEEIYRHVYKDSKEAYDSIFEYIESWYNRKRTHSSLGYKTPATVHAECAA